VGSEVSVKVGAGVLLGIRVGDTGVRMAVGVLVPQDARTNITTIERIVFTVDMLSSLPSLNNVPGRGVGATFEG
jgi:hypothetical protein